MIFWSIAALLGLYGLHRLARWMEDKGWIYYQTKRAHPDAMGAAALELQRLVNPGAKHVLEITRQRRSDKRQTAGQRRDPSL
ncbi:MAG TPA: hypothetical protein VMT15_18760 [Bryobacteraceae bacterium]|nr:hypothetical protein [Bryobacteraceae bacterium]